MCWPFPSAASHMNLVFRHQDLQKAPICGFVQHLMCMQSRLAGTLQCHWLQHAIKDYEPSLQTALGAFTCVDAKLLQPWVLHLYPGCTCLCGRLSKLWCEAWCMHLAQKKEDGTNTELAGAHRGITLPLMSMPRMLWPGSLAARARGNLPGPAMHGTPVVWACKQYAH